MKDIVQKRVDELKSAREQSVMNYNNILGRLQEAELILQLCEQVDSEPSDEPAQEPHEETIQ